MTDQIETTRLENRIELFLNRPDKRNAMTGAMYTALAAAIEEAETDPAIVAVIIAAHGKGFCAGNDLGDFMANPPQGNDSPVERFLRAISTSSKALIAAVQGSCVGVGATMLLHCDYVAAAPSTSLQFSFAKIGLVPEAASSLLLPRAVGTLAASRLMLTGDPIPADVASKLGLVSEVVGEGDQLAAAQDFAEKLEQMPRGALRATKRLLRSSSTDVESRMAEESAVFTAQLASDEFLNMARAFMQKSAA